jgi:Fur family transcriptional regulator, ferric uptake regulator
MSARRRIVVPDDTVGEISSPRGNGADVDEIHDAVAARLGNNIIRYTKTRRTVVEVLARARQPLTVDEIRTMTAAPLSSVYRTLAILEEVGLVHRLTNDNSEYARFELAEDLLGHHHHLACANCGTMTDVTLPHNIEADLDRALALLAKQQHFTVDGHRLDIIGTCATCTDIPRANREPTSDV